MIEFWEFAAFLANSLVFLLMGSAMATIDFAREGWLRSGAGRALRPRRPRDRGLSGVPRCSRGRAGRSRSNEQHLLWWGGLRGALALALALALPPHIPQREDILIVAFAVVAFSVIVQGLTAPFVLKALGLTPARG